MPCGIFITVHCILPQDWGVCKRENVISPQKKEENSIEQMLQSAPCRVIITAETYVRGERGIDMAQMTKMQQRIYDCIAEALQRQGYPPSVREIGEAVGLKSPSTVHFHLKHMEEMGVLTKGAGKGRALTLAQPVQGEALAGASDAAPVQEEAEPAADRIPVVGTVAAGSPILAEECIEDYLTFDTGGREGEYFALRVRGESMLNTGILPGDLVVVHRQPTAHNGEIVVALLGDEATVKRLSRRNGEVWLLPENENYRPIDGRHATLLGKVTAVVRQYS